MRGIVKFGLKPFVVIWFWGIRWQRHNQLLSWLKNDKIGKASIFALPFGFLGGAQREIGRICRDEFTNYALPRYVNYIRYHYSAEGV